MVTQYAKVTISFSNTRIITYRLKKFHQYKSTTFFSSTKFFSHIFHIRIDISHSALAH